MMVLISMRSLITFDWGTHFAAFSSTPVVISTTVYCDKNRDMGLNGEFLEVFISRKLP